MLPSGTLALTNVAINISGDYFYCEIGWSDDMTYNATYQIIINSCEFNVFYRKYLKIPCDLVMNSTDNHLTKAMKPSLKSGKLYLL